MRNAIKKSKKQDLMNNKIRKRNLTKEESKLNELEKVDN